MIHSRSKRKSKTSAGSVSASGKTGKARKMHLNVHRSGGASGPRPEFNVPPSDAQPKQVFTTCHYCGYDPGVVPPDGTCPKCGGHSWERHAISVRLLPKTKVLPETK